MCIRDRKYIIGLKKNFTGSYRPALEIEVHPSKFGIHVATKLSLIDIKYEIITVKTGRTKQASDINLSLLDII